MKKSGTIFRTGRFETKPNRITRNKKIMFLEDRAEEIMRMQQDAEL